MILTLVLALAQVAVATREPLPATPWSETVSGTCGRSTIRVERAVRPLGVPARVLVDGRRIGPAGRALERELGDGRAAYRFGFACLPGGRGMELRWVRGLADGRGGVRYTAGVATFARGTLISARSEDAAADAFWYR